MPDPNTRDQLANERTFLAWIRTSIALMGFGVLIACLLFIEGITLAHIRRCPLRAQPRD